MKSAAICIATYRRDPGLRRLLRALENQRAPSGWHVHVRVINNDPTADRASWVREMHADFPEVRFGFEVRRNIAHARNAAIRMAPAHAFLFIDDDEVPAEGWLAALLSRLEDADAAFGPVIGRVSHDTPAWLARTGAFDKPGPDHDNEIEWTGTRTSSTAVRGEWFHQHRQWFDPDYGTSGGSDTELFHRLAKAGARFVHERRGLVYEDIEPERCTAKAVVLRRYRAGAVFGRMQPRATSIARHSDLVKRFAFASVIALAGLPSACCSRPAPLFNAICRFAVAIGIWRGHHREYRVTRYPAASAASPIKAAA